MPPLTRQQSRDPDPAALPTAVDDWRAIRRGDEAATAGGRAAGSQTVTGQGSQGGIGSFSRGPLRRGALALHLQRAAET